MTMRSMAANAVNTNRGLTIIKATKAVDTVEEEDVKTSMAELRGIRSKELTMIVTKAVDTVEDANKVEAAIMSKAVARVEDTVVDVVATSLSMVVEARLVVITTIRISRIMTLRLTGLKVEVDTASNRAVVEEVDMASSREEEAEVDMDSNRVVVEVVDMDSNREEEVEVDMAAVETTMTISKARRSMLRSTLVPAAIRACFPMSLASSVGRSSIWRARALMNRALSRLIRQCMVVVVVALPQTMVSWGYVIALVDEFGKLLTVASLLLLCKL